MAKAKMTEALAIQGAAWHWLNPFEMRVRCGSRVGGCSIDRDFVTCSACLEGRRSADTVTDPYGRQRRGQLELL